MTELDFANAFGPMFWIIMALVTLVLVVAGYWLGGLVGRKTDTGFGALMILILVTLMVASSVIPAAIFGALGDIMAVMNPMAPVDDTVLMNQGRDAFPRVLIATVVSLGSVVAFFIAAVVGLARGDDG